MLQSAYMIRRLKKDVLDQLPDKRRQMIHLDVEQKSINEINRAIAKGRQGGDDGGGACHTGDDFESMMEKVVGYRPCDSKPGAFNDYMDQLDEEGKEDSDMGGFMVAYRLTGEAKVKGVCEFVETLYENGAKFLIFAHHTSVITELEKFVQSKKIGYVRIDGKVSFEKRHERV